MAGTLRCRLGKHRYQRVKQPRGAGEEWVMRCRDCGRAPRSGVAIGYVIFAVVLIVAAVVFWWAPLLGSLLIVGAVSGLGWLVVPAAVERVARWLTIGR